MGRPASKSKWKLDWRSAVLTIALLLKPLLTPATATAETIVVPPSANANIEISRALERARSLRRLRPEQGITIELGSGTHRLTEPVRLGPGDAGTPDHPLVIRGARGVTLTGSVPLERTMPVKSLLSRLPTISRDHVIYVSAPASATLSRRIETPRTFNHVARPTPFELFEDDGPLVPARWPNDTFAMSGAVAAAKALVLPGERISRWLSEADLWLAGYLSEDWSFETLPIASLDPAKAILTLDGTPLFELKPARRIFVFHAASKLDSPGEWYRDLTSRKLAIWPRNPGSSIEASVAQGIFRIEGTSHIRIADMELVRTRDDAVRVSASRDVVLAGVTIRDVAGRAAVFERSVSSGIRSSFIDQTGEGGVVLDGGERTTLLPAGLFAENNHITRYARLGRTYKPAVLLAGVGNIARGNYIADSEHMAIYVHGNEHIVEGNEITSVLSETSDAGAIYSGRDWTARGNRIIGNYIHDIAGGNADRKGIYLDDMASGFRVEDNLLIRIGQPIFIGGGRDNVVTRNIVISTDAGITVDARGLTWARSAITSPDSELRSGLKRMPVQSPLWRARYPGLAAILEDQPGTPTGNQISANLIASPRPYDVTPEAARVLNLTMDRISPIDQIASSASSAGDFARANASLLRELGRDPATFHNLDRRNALTR